jgi:glycosyltransferase involved in cell wall biosynthesis
MRARQVVGEMQQRVDLHVHSLHSSKPYSWFLRSVRSAECYTRVAEVHRLATERGMTAVTISDHDTIDGALELCTHFPNTFVSEEISARFPEDGCVVHTIAVDINEAQHREIQRLRRNIYELIPYLREQQIPHFWCHPLSHVNSRMRSWHVRSCFLMFRLLEMRNGTRDEAHETQLQAILARLRPSVLAEYAEALPSTPWINRDGRYGLVGGSDDHGTLGIARAFTEYDGAPTGASVRAALTSLAVQPGGDHGTGVSLAHNAYGVAAGNVRGSGQLGVAAARSVGATEPAASGSLSMMKFLGGLRSAFSAVGGSVAEVWSYGHRDEFHRRVSESAEAALIASWRQVISRLASELRQARVADAADVVPELIKLVLAELPYILSYRYFGRDGREAQTFAQELFPSSSDAAPRVAIFADTTETTDGVSVGLARLVSTARGLGYSIDVVGPTAADKIERPAPGHVRLPSVYAHQLPEYPSYSWHIPHLPALLRYLLEERIELVQIATPGPMGVMASVAGRLLRIPVVGQYHTDVPRYAQHLLGDPTAAQMVERFVVWFYRSLDAVYAPSAFTARDLISKGLDDHKVIKISRGIPLADFDAAAPDPELRARLGSAADAFLVLYVGRVSKEKNLEAALASFAKLVASAPSAQMVVVGDGPMRAELAGRGQPNVHFLGEIVGPALASIYAACDVFLFPSETDTFANVVVEAIAAGLPVITAQHSAAAEHCQHGVNGFVVNISDATEVAMRLRWLQQNPPLRAKMAQESRALSRRYDLVTAAHGMFDEYARVLARTRAPLAGAHASASARRP